MAETTADKIGVLQTQYLAIFTHANIFHLPPSNCQQFPTMYMVNIHPSGVIKVLYDIDTNKTTAPDLITKCVLKEISSISAHVLADQLNRIWEHAR